MKFMRFVVFVFLFFSGLLIQSNVAKKYSRDIMILGGGGFGGGGGGGGPTIIKTGGGKKGGGTLLMIPGRRR